MILFLFSFKENALKNVFFLIIYYSYLQYYNSLSQR